MGVVPATRDPTLNQPAGIDHMQAAGAPMSLLTAW